MPPARALAAWGWRGKPFRTPAAWFLGRARELKRAGPRPAPAERIRLPRVKKPRRAARRGAAGLKRGKPRARTAVRARKMRAGRAAPRGRGGGKTGKARKVRKKG